MSRFQFDATADDAGKRLDVALVRHVEGLGRAGAKKLVQKGLVKVNGRKVKKGAVLARGDSVEIAKLPASADFRATPAPEVPLEVLHEDARCVVVHKPPGMPSHPLRADETHTLACALVARYPEMGDVGYSPREPGILHRLDNDTSGLMIAARDKAAFDALRDDLMQHRIEKRYLALTAGRVRSPQWLRDPIANHPRDRRRVKVCRDELEAIRLGARAAATEVLTSTRMGMLSLVEVSASMARRHQVRAHLAAAGHPLAGDFLYGGPMIEGLDRHFLHASSLRFRSPTGDEVRVDAPLPEPLQRVVESLGTDGEG